MSDNANVFAMEIHSVKELAAMVRGMRQQKGWTQAKLAQECGMGREWIIHLEQARPGLEFGRVMSALKALGVRLRVEPWQAQKAEIDLGQLLGDHPTETNHE